jgi:hypothetical protein
LGRARPRLRLALVVAAFTHESHIMAFDSGPNLTDRCCRKTDSIPFRLIFKGRRPEKRHRPLFKLLILFKRLA